MPLPLCLTDVVMISFADVATVALRAACEAFWESWRLAFVTPGY